MSKLHVMAKPAQSADKKALKELRSQLRSVERRIATIERRLLKGAVRSAGAEEKIVTLLRKVSPLGFREIVDGTGLNPNTVKMTLRAMRRDHRVLHGEKKYSL